MEKQCKGWSKTPCTEDLVLQIPGPLSAHDVNRLTCHTRQIAELEMKEASEMFLINQDKDNEKESKWYQISEC